MSLLRFRYETNMHREVLALMLEGCFAILFLTFGGMAYCEGRAIFAPMWVIGSVLAIQGAGRAYRLSRSVEFWNGEG